MMLRYTNRVLANAVHGHQVRYLRLVVPGQDRGPALQDVVVVGRKRVIVVIVVHRSRRHRLRLDTRITGTVALARHLRSGLR